MLNSSQINFMSTVILITLSFSAFANAGLDEKAGLSEKSNNNLVELFKVKKHATKYIKNIEEKLRSTNDDEQEELLVELAQSLLYYQERHKPESNANGLHSKKSSTKSLKSKSIILNKALNAYKKASTLALDRNRIKYTRELSELAVKLQKKETLVQIFDELLQHGGDETGTYLAHIDYAKGLAEFKDYAANTQFLSAINMRTLADGVEANFRYANYLLDINKPREALNILEKFSFDERRLYVHIAMLRQKTMHLLKLDTQEVDNEVKQLRKKLSKSPFIGAISKLTGSVKKTPTNTFDIPTAHAFTSTHNNERDDSRGKYGNLWIVSSENFLFSKFIINAAEVIYNEARGDQQLARYAVAWAIRNRAMIDMNGADFYPGAEGYPRVKTCREATRDGPKPFFSDTFKRYSCVVHGGTTIVGAPHSQMNDTHVSMKNLESSGILWEIFNVVNGWIPDPTAPKPFSVAIYPEIDVSTGNPEGAQEWQRNNYCAKNHSSKVRLGNVGGRLPDPEAFCSIKRVLRDNKYSNYSTDNFFWGRKRNSDYSK